MRWLVIFFTLYLPAGSIAADFVITNSNKGNYALEIAGTLRDGDTDRLMRIVRGFDSFPVTVRLRISGGSLTEAIRFGQLVRQSYLPVMADQGCELPCFLVLVGGVSRAISADLVLAPRPGPATEVFEYMQAMGVPKELASDIADPASTVEISINDFDAQIGENPAPLQQAMVAQCGEYSDSELADFRRIQAQSFLESLRVLAVSSDRSEELSPIIDKYAGIAEGVDSLSMDYRERLEDKWHAIRECRKGYLEDLQVDALKQVVARVDNR